MSGLHIEHRGAIPHDESRRVIADGRVERTEAAAKETAVSDDELLGQLADAERAADGVRTVARAGHRVIDQQQGEGR